MNDSKTLENFKAIVGDSFRERPAATGRDRLVWAELQRQLDEKSLRVRKGVAKDATFITCARRKMASADA